MNISLINKVVWCLALIGVLVPAIGRAQLAVNMSLVDMCTISRRPPEQSSVFSAWMSGWFNPKTGHTYVNLEAYARNVANVRKKVDSIPVNWL